MSRRPGQLRLLIAVLLAGAIIGATVTSVLGQSGTTQFIRSLLPPTAQPQGGTSSSTTPIPFQSMDANGTDTSSAVLPAVLQQLPFHAKLPSIFPVAMRPVHSNAQLIGADKRHGNLDVLYASAGSPAEPKTVHIFETNQLLEGKQPTEQGSQSQSLPIGSGVWSYRLLSYPQPDGSTYQLHDLSRTFEDGVYVEIDTPVGAIPDVSLAELKQIVASLR